MIEKDYKEKFCPACSRYKPASGVWHRVESKGRFAYYRCDDCQHRRSGLRGVIKPVKENK